ncbi:MAG: hypothetical protein ACTJLL_04305 [Anaplasma sp.]
MLLWSRCCCICVVAALLLCPRICGVDFYTTPENPAASHIASVAAVFASSVAKSSGSEVVKVVSGQTDAEVDTFAVTTQQTRGSQKGAEQWGHPTDGKMSKIAEKRKFSPLDNFNETSKKNNEEVRARESGSTGGYSPLPDRASTGVSGGIYNVVSVPEDETSEEQKGSCQFANQGVYSARGASGGLGMPGRTTRFGVKVCGAWPSCGNCSTLYTGDCKYVFPTFVTVYEKRDEKDGRSKLCACKALACDLPWDPSGWNKSCFQELGCVDKPFLHMPGPFCHCLYGGDRTKVRFVPLQFSEQSFWRPGIVAIVEQGSRVGGKGTYGVSSKHIIRPSGDSAEDKSTPRKTEPLSKDGYQYHISGPAITMQYQDYSFNSDGREHYLKLRRGKDSVCVKYYGSDANRVTELLEECLPIPHMPTPRVYRAARSVESGHGQSKYSVLSEGYVVAKKIGGEYYEGAKQHYVKRDTEHYTGTGSRTMGSPEPGAQQFVSYSEKESEKQAVVAYEGIFKNEEIDGKVPKVGDKDTYVLPLTSVRKKQVGYVFRECIGFPGEEKCHEDTEDVSSVYGHAVGHFRGYSGKWFTGNSSGAVVRDSLKNGPLRFIDVALYDKNNKKEREIKEREIVEVCVPGVHSSGYGCVESGKVTPASGVKCIFGEENDASEYEIFGTDAGNLLRVWLRRYPSVLRRYVLVGGGDNTRRVPCDDKYTVSLRTLNQQTMDNMSIREGQFLIHEDAIGGGVQGGSDLCAQPKLGVVYYYEPGKFTTEAGDLAGCKSRGVQYYSPQDKVESCTYEYMNLGDYSPVSPGDHVSGKNPPQERRLDLRPLNIYDRGMCVDNFPRAWYKPEYRVRNKQAELVSKEYVIAGPFTLGKGLGTLSGKPCQFLKIEAWGGGEAAMKENGGTHRSGRPGQYIMSILHDPRNGHATFLSHANSVLKSVLTQSADTSGRGVSLQPNDLVFWIVADIGEGGEHDKPKKQERHQETGEYYVRMKEEGQRREERIDKGTNITYGGGTGAGGDTVVKLCVSKRNALNSGEGVQDDVKQGSAWNKIPANKVLCYEMMRAVGGGSERAGGVDKDLIANLVLSYRTITGDVLLNDQRANRLMLEGHGMFTKFPLEMNFPITNSKEKELQISDYFEGRSLPKASCQYRSRYSKWNNGDIFVPGMGGCWNRDKSGTLRDKPGLGQSGAVMVTCELWTAGSTATEVITHTRGGQRGSTNVERGAQSGRVAAPSNAARVSSTTHPETAGSSRSK